MHLPTIWRRVNCITQNNIIVAPCIIDFRSFSVFSAFTIHFVVGIFGIL